MASLVFMRPPKSWNLAQRIVLVVASAVALSAIARQVLYLHPSGGWFGYAPDTAPLRPGPVGRFNDTATTLLTIAFVGVWVAVSFWLLRDHDADG
jgi:hypothetical protein